VLDVEAVEFRVPVGYVRNWVTVCIGGSCREANTLNNSPSKVDDASRLMEVAISSNASFFRSPILCYSNLR
jgi:hypothetical protein